MTFRIACTALIALATVSLESQAAEKSNFSLHKALGKEYVCAIYQRPIQFVSEDELLFLAGPTSDCYRQVTELHLVVLSLDQHIVARKEWPATLTGVVIPFKRIALAASDQLLILNDRLETVQSLPLPKHRGFPVLSVGEGDLFVGTDGGSLTCDGLPLKCTEGKSTSRPSGDVQVIYTFADGRMLERNGESLIETAPGGRSKQIADLSWVAPPCKKYEYCQGWDAGTGFQVVTGKKRRVLVMSNGSRFPVTDAAGLFPYFRIQVFDLETGLEIFREEDITRTGHRSAALSPDGDLLATFDANSVAIHKLR